MQHFIKPQSLRILSSYNLHHLRHASTAAVVRGLRKDPEQYMTSPLGITYPGDATTLSAAQKFLDGYKLPDKLLLQCLVHKSFAHGKIPYNEKLAALGQQALRVETARSAAARPSEQISSLGTGMNGFNFDISGAALEVLTSTPVLAAVCERAQIDRSLFFNTPTRVATDTVKAKTINALVGALLLEKGASHVSDFVSKRLIGGEYDIFSIADKIFDPNHFKGHSH